MAICGFIEFVYLLKPFLIKWYASDGDGDVLPKKRTIEKEDPSCFAFVVAAASWPLDRIGISCVNPHHHLVLQVSPRLVQHATSWPKLYSFGYDFDRGMYNIVWSQNVQAFKLYCYMARYFWQYNILPDCTGWLYSQQLCSHQTVALFSCSSFTSFT